MGGPKAPRATLFALFVQALNFFKKPRTRLELAEHLEVDGMAAHRLIHGMIDAGVLRKMDRDGAFVYQATKRLRAN